MQPATARDPQPQNPTITATTTGQIIVANRPIQEDADSFTGHEKHLSFPIDANQKSYLTSRQKTQIEKRAKEKISAGKKIRELNTSIGRITSVLAQVGRTLADCARTDDWMEVGIHRREILALLRDLWTILPTDRINTRGLVTSLEGYLLATACELWRPEQLHAFAHVLGQFGSQSDLTDQDAQLYRKLLRRVDFDIWRILEQPAFNELDGSTETSE